MSHIPSKTAKKPFKKQFFPEAKYLRKCLKKGGPPSFGHPVYATYTTFWHENIFRGPWNNICKIYFGEYIS